MINICKKKIKQIKKMYSKLSAPVKASLWFTICSVIQKGITLLSTPIFTRLLTTEQYGVYSVYQSWYTIISIFATLHLSAGILFNGLTKYEDDRERLISSFQGLSTTVTILLFIVYLIGMNYFNKILELNPILMFAMFVELLFVPAYAYWAVKERFDYKYKKIIILTLLVAIGSPALGIISVLSTSFKAEARVLSYVFVSSFEGLIFYIINFKKGKVFFDKKYWKYALNFNLPLIPHYLSMTVLNQADRIMIRKYVGLEYAGIYSVAYQVSMMMNIITIAINNSYIPYTYKNMKKEKYNGINKNSNYLLLIVGGLCVVAMAFGPEIIKIFASKEYYQAIWIIPPVAASVYFMFLYSLFANIEFYFEKTKYVMVASCAGAITNIILNYIYIQKYGFIAAGYTTLFCYILFSLAHYIFYRIVIKQKNISNIYNLKYIILISIMLFVFMLIMPFMYINIIIRYIFLLILLIIIFIYRKKIINIFISIKRK